MKHHWFYNKDTYEKYFERVTHILLYGICDTINLLFNTGGFGVPSTYDNS